MIEDVLRMKHNTTFNLVKIKLKQSNKLQDTVLVQQINDVINEISELIASS
jgi:hypothetical protein